MKLKDKVAIVTGSTRGIGRGIAERFVKEGAIVVVNGRKTEDCKRVAKEIDPSGKKTVAIAADMSDAGQIKNLIYETVKKLGRIDILVNNAGIVGFENFVDMKEESWNKLIDVDLKGCFLCAQAAAKQMIKQGKGGKIVNIASIAGTIAYPQLAHYCAAKAGVINMTKVMALELGRHKINVNAIGPGVIESDMTKPMLSDPNTEKGFMAKIPLGRIGKPEDIGAAAAFLASDDADYITGATLFVDGGWLVG
jgi:glucose 1-dehydrogenase